MVLFVILCLSWTDQPGVCRAGAFYRRDFEQFQAVPCLELVPADQRAHVVLCRKEPIGEAS